jgi:hypothetical protein
MSVAFGMQPNLGLNPVLAIPVVLLAYWATLRRLRLNNLVLLVAGFWLYAWGSPVGGLLLFILTLFNYYLAKYLTPSPISPGCAWVRFDREYSGLDSLPQCIWSERVPDGCSWICAGDVFLHAAKFVVFGGTISRRIPPTA